MTSRQSENEIAADAAWYQKIMRLIRGAAMPARKSPYACGGLIVFAPRRFAQDFAQSLAISTMQPNQPAPPMTLAFSKKR